jgi:mono/diheme cytochrome c family protein
MKKIRKISKWTGLVLLFIVCGIAVVTASRQHLKYEAPYPNIKASRDSAIIARGKHLVFDVAHCSGCHTTVNQDSLLAAGQEVPLTGGYLFKLPVGDIYSKNITPDRETGIGRYTDAEIARSLYYGVHPDGTAVYNFMPFHNASEEDMIAIISYLRSQKPVYNAVPENRLNVAGNLVRAFMVKPVGPSGTIPKSVRPDTTADYGKYLTTSLADCNGCHTRRNISGDFIGEPFAGGGPMEHKGFPPVTPPNLTPDSTSRIFKWSQKTFIARFRMGRLVPHSPMPWAAFGRMTDDELKAIYKFLKSVKPAKTFVQK